jgi:phosphoribosylanthranilate isomerase
MVGRVRVKLCGITNAADARVCVTAGADALGFIFAENTPRYIEPAMAASIIAQLPPFVTPVGVFWDHKPEHVKAISQECRLRALQFHGDEPPETLQDYWLPVIKTIKVSGPTDFDRMSGYRVSAFLVDSALPWSEGQARAPLPWGMVRRGTAGRRIILAGGLTPENVAEAIDTVRPFAVDVTSGVELRPGRKDHDRVSRFVAAVRATPVDM